MAKVRDQSFHSSFSTITIPNKSLSKRDYSTSRKEYREDMVLESKSKT